MDRRDFIRGCAALGAMTTGGCQIFTGAPGQFDDRLTVLLSDMHYNGGSEGLKHQCGMFHRAVLEILRMDPLPRRALIFGDLAFQRGTEEDYRASAPEIELLRQTGIEVAITMGNHDHRAAFFDRYPAQAKTTPVPGRTVSVVEMPDVDFILLDSLQENPDGPGSRNPGDGVLDEAQGEWLRTELGRRTKPVFVGAHHPIKELSVGGKPLKKLLIESPCVAGYVFGHEHRWIKHWEHYGYEPELRILRTVGLPSTGWWGDIGYALLRTEDGKATVSLRETDYFFPEPVPAERRPAIWDQMLKENAGASETFLF